MNGSRQMVSQFIPALQNAIETPVLTQALAEVDKVLCPPAVYLQAVGENLQSQKLFKLGAQNSYCESKGAYTGEISPEMLKDMGCEYVILGHSERRQLFAESDELIARKFVAAYHAGLIPILCVGETEGERAQGRAFEVVCRQLEAVLKIAPISLLRKSCIAYEPVWAIGTGQTATPAQAEAVHAHIRSWLASRDVEVAAAVRILYGGSIKADNAVQLFAEPNIDGGLIGGASLEVKDFLNICLQAAQAKR
jgi:triosephosphate isomerase